jgi:hypothetical protein
MERIPRIKAVQPLEKTRLSVQFDNNCTRIYDCAAIMARPAFRLLKDPGFFKTVKVDTGGYGIIWNDDVDLSEYELWTNGREQKG